MERAHIVGEVDLYTTVRGTSSGVPVGIDVVAGQVHAPNVTHPGLTLKHFLEVGAGLGRSRGGTNRTYEGLAMTLAR
jgi:hypothetical protein